MANMEEKIETLVKKTIQELGYDLYDVEYVKEGKDFFLRIFIDKPEGINVEDCETVNNAINDIIDEADYIKGPYFLEVSSPGIERNIRKEKHLKQNIGKEIEVKLFKPVGGAKQWTGLLEQYDANTIVIKQEETLLSIDRKNIAQMKTVYNW